MRKSKRTSRRVCVLMMSTTQRLEAVEAAVLVSQVGEAGDCQFHLVEKEAEAAARRTLADNGKTEANYDYVGTLVANLRGPFAGRVNWGKNPEMRVSEIWS